jgi:hypothetical protein
MSPPITCTAGCSGPAWLASSFTMLSTEVAIDAISGIGTACCLHLLLDRCETSVLEHDRWLVPKRALLLVWHCIFFSHKFPCNTKHLLIAIKSHPPHNCAASCCNERKLDNDNASDNCNYGRTGPYAILMLLDLLVCCKRRSLTSVSLRNLLQSVTLNSRL